MTTLLLALVVVALAVAVTALCLAVRAVRRPTQVMTVVNNPPARPDSNITFTVNNTAPQRVTPDTIRRMARYMGR